MGLLYLYIRKMNDIIFISSSIPASSLELEDTDTNKPLTKVACKRILVESLGIREERVDSFYVV